MLLHRFYKSFIIALLVLMLVFGFYCFYKPPIHNITVAELDSINGIRYDGPIFLDIVEYLIENPNSKVDDLRNVKGVGDEIIKQLERKWR